METETRGPEPRHEWTVQTPYKSYSGKCGNGQGRIKSLPTIYLPAGRMPTLRRHCFYGLQARSSREAGGTPT